MLRTVEGVYRNGQVELLENPIENEGARVLVTFINGHNAGAPGTDGAVGRIMSTEEDFKIAEWRGETEFDDSYKPHSHR